MPSKKLKNLLNPSGNGDLANMVERAQAMGELTQRLQSVLSAELASSLVAANISAEKELIVIARSPAWAARLRFETDKLIAAAQEADSSVSGCSVRVTHDCG